MWDRAQPCREDEGWLNAFFTGWQLVKEAEFRNGWQNAKRVETVEQFWPDSPLDRVMRGLVGGSKHITIVYHPHIGPVGTFVSLGDGERFVIERIERRFPDDWFNNDWIAHCGQPWNDRPQGLKIEWLEDQLFPRVSA